MPILVLAVVVGCDRERDTPTDAGPTDPGPTDTTETDSGEDPTEPLPECTRDEPTVPVRAIAAAARLEIVGEDAARLGTSVACTSAGAGSFPTAIAAGGPEDDSGGGAYGWVAVVPGDRTGTVPLPAADLVIRGTEYEDQVGTRVVFPGDVDGDGTNELLVTAMNAYRPDAITGAGFLFDVQSGARAPEDARTHFVGDIGARLGGAAVAGDLDGDGRAEVLLGHTFQNHPDTRGHLALHRGTTFPPTVAPDAADVQFRSLDRRQPPGLVMTVVDLDGDGASDLAHGEYGYGGAFAPGRVTVLTGPLLDGPSRTLNDAEIVIDGDASAPVGIPGLHLATGDWSGDGVVDLAISDHVLPGQAGERAGKVFVFFGPIARGRHDVTEADLVLEGDRAYTMFGNGLVSLDHDGDGQADLAVGAPEDPSFPTGCTGRVYVFAGPLSAGTLSPDRDARVAYEDDLVGALFGDAMAACDLDADGDDELVMGSRWATLDPEAERAGRVHVVDGGAWP